MKTATFRIWRGDAESGNFADYRTEVSEGMVVLDAVHKIQAEQANDLACRWNCKAGKCGSCSAEVNGMPRLMCMTRMNDLPLDQPVTIEPMKAFPRVRDLVNDVSWNFRVKEKIKPFKPRPPDAPDGTWRMAQADVDRVQEFRKCIECFLCQNVCHVLREHQMHEEFIGPRFLVYAAALEMHPLDVEDSGIRRSAIFSSRQCLNSNHFRRKRCRPRWSGPPGIGCSTNRRRLRAFVWMCCAPIRRISRRWSSCC
jgi:succinate dehydrogenase / fumarate reductase iron-sulfur subunit